MGLRFRDLVTEVGMECMAGPVPPGCGCTQSANAPQCTKGSQNPNPRPNCPKGSGPARPPKRVEGLEQLRHQLRATLTSG